MMMVIAITEKGEKKMARYIDAEKAKTFFEEIDAGSRAHSTLLTPYEFAEYLDEIPTVDVQEVRHGKWIEDKETGSLMCSECGHFTDEIIGDMIEADEDISLALEIPQKTIIHRSMNPIYCSKCGAKMDGEREEEVENA